MSATQSMRIVVGVDGSPSSVQALKWAFGQAVLTGSGIGAVCAWHYPSSYGVPFPDDADYRALAEETATKAIAEARTADHAYDTVPVRPVVVKAQPAQALLEQAKGATLLVVGCRGHGGFSEALLGSVGQHVAHHAPCPVVIIRDKVELAMSRGAATTADAAGAGATGAGVARADRARTGRDGQIDKSCLADELGAALVQLSTVLRRAILPPQISLTQASTLLILRDDGPQRVTSLAEAAQVTQPTMSALVIGMERLGWVRRDASSTDRRAVAVCLTGGGDQVIRELEAARSRALLADLDALTAPDLAALVAALPALRGIIAHEQQSKAVAW